MNLSDLEKVARSMVVKGKGLLAADESSSTIKKRFESIQLDSTEEHRRTYRDMLLTAPGAQEWVSGVILYDETIRQKTAAGVNFADYLARIGVLPGIKVDLGAKPLAGFPGETITEGLDGLRERLQEYYRLGARFAKWRAVIDIARDIPSAYAIESNAQALARYAALCQEQQIVPIVEPEVLMDGDHSIERCEAVTSETLQAVFDQLHKHRIYLEGMVLKPNMVISGKKAAHRASPEAVAQATVRCLKRHVPAAVAGIAFLSGGQASQEATLHLSLMNRIAGLPWNLTFSYGRALQDAALKGWGGTAAGYTVGQQEYLKRAHLNSLATQGRYSADLENKAA